MASWVLSECGLNPLPKIYPKPRTGHGQSFLNSNPTVLRFSRTDERINFSSSFSSGIVKNRSWVLKVSAPLRIEQLEGEEAIEGGKTVINGGEEFFDPGAPPPFKLSDIRAAIPKHCWFRNPWRSTSYVVRDVCVVFGLAAVAAYFKNWFVWPLYWFAQSTMFWALFVLGHDWRISHRTHHQNHGHVENDESWHPLPEKIFKNLDNVTKKLRFTLPFPMLAYPIYLWSRSPGKIGSHFHPDSDLFVPNERKGVITSTACWTAMVALLSGLSFLEWKATEAAKPVLGKYYREPQKSGPLPFFLLGVLLRSMKKDHYVSDTGDIVYYQTDPQLNPQ
ncbi:hypothetical protein OROGR_015943 [Orobanche gracilis]